MRTTVENVSDVEIKVSIQVDSAQVDAEYQRQLRRLSKQVRMKGFRKGKAPAKMVEKMYGTELGAETAIKLIEATVDEAMGSLGRQVVAQPNVSPALASPGAPMEYDVRVEVKPEVTVEGWRGLEVSCAKHELQQEAIDAEVGRVQQSHAERVPVEDRGAETGDILVVATDGKIGGETDERLHTHDMEVPLGSGSLIPGFEDQLIGAKAGQELEVSVTFPEDYGTEDLQGAEAVFDVRVDGHFVMEVPDLDDDLAQDAGHASLDALRAHLEQRLQQSLDGEMQSELDSNMVGLLLERHQVPVPPSMVRGQLEHQHQRFTTMLMMQGVPYEKAMEMARENQGQLLGEAERAVRRYLLLEALAKSQGIELDDDGVSAEISARVEREGERVASLYSRDEAKEGLRLELRERATLDLLKEHATITETAPVAEDEAQDQIGADDDAKED